VVVVPACQLEPSFVVPEGTGRFVPESRFGVWFIGTGIWANHVLKRALDDLERLIQNRRDSYPMIVDFGCGFGRALKMLNDRFHPGHLAAVDFDSEMLSRAQEESQRHGLTIGFRKVSNALLPFADQSVDMIFCHQTFHHVVDQHEVLKEFYRVLKPGGLLLFAESTRKYIHSWLIRLLFRHPLDKQRTASEYITMISEAGFKVCQDSISYPYLWWSRSDFALMENLFGIVPSADREETLINLVAIRD
jgi:ubiquinone/menaquinone biosynthesis C-methylase UbiE